MMEFFNNGMVWWVTAIEIPALAGLLALVLRVREALANYKLDAIRAYASVSEVRELEKRLVSHLLRIEAKLDTTALKTESLFKGGAA